MGLQTAISSALSGLQATQQGLTLVADNVANANTPGYVRKTLSLANSASGNGVQVVGIARELDTLVQQQLRTELAGGNYASTINDFYTQLSQTFGTPGGNNALDTLFNNLTSSLNALGTSPDSIAAQGDVLNQAQVLVQHLNSMSSDVQQLRSQAESGIADGVNRVNQLLQDIAQVSTKLTAAGSSDAASAGLLDQRDSDITELSGLMDIRVVATGNNGGISIFTSSGVALYDGQAAQLSFDARPALNPSSSYSTDPTKRTVGTISLVTPNGDKIDLIGSKAIRSGTLAADVQMRDVILPQAQSQLDEIANSLALSLSNRTQQGTAATSGAQSGFDLDLSGLQNGNTISLVYTDNSTNTQHKVTIVRVNDPSTLPLSNSLTADPNDQVIGVDFSGGMASVVSQLNTALGSANLTFSNPSGSTLRVLDDGAPNLSDVNGFNASVTTTTLNSGDPTLPFFVDGSNNSLYTGAITAGGLQKTGFAARIAVNPALMANPSALVAYSNNTASGDSTRPDFIYEQLTAAAQLFSPTSGIGTASGPFSGTVADYIQQTISQQGAAADNASKLNQGQQVVVNALQTRFNDASGVNIDTEMSTLLTLQNAYSANARVMTAINQMFSTLLSIGSTTG
ncbi:MAG TPA: flagellar hook-associated protein FlgK [Xanthobacteraceae bacterium]|nr:flagellar hook-associated protein FlgK [Xanthobacteraceae bacterium]